MSVFLRGIISKKNEADNCSDPGEHIYGNDIPTILKKMFDLENELVNQIKQYTRGIIHDTNCSNKA